MLDTREAATWRDMTDLLVDCSIAIECWLSSYCCSLWSFFHSICEKTTYVRNTRGWWAFVHVVRRWTSEVVRSLNVQEDGNMKGSANIDSVPLNAQHPVLSEERTEMALLQKHQWRTEFETCILCESFTLARLHCDRWVGPAYVANHYHDTSIRDEVPHYLSSSEDVSTRCLFFV